MLKPFNALLFVVLVFGGCVLVAPSLAWADTFEIDCDYPEDPPDLVRIPVEAQTWWTQAPDGSGHTYGMLRHGVCLPLDLPDNRVKVTGPLRMKFHTRIINNGVGTTEFYRIRVYAWGDSDQESWDIDSGDYGECPEGHICDFFNEIIIPINEIAHTGQYEFRLHAKTRKVDGPLEGKEQFTTSGYQIFIDNGKSTTSAYRSKGQQIARGWYTDREYQNAQIQDPGTYPLGDYSEPFDLTVKMDHGSGGETPDRTFVSIDPGVNNPLGKVVLDHRGPFSGTVTIDPATVGDGRHSIGLWSCQLGLESGNEGMFMAGLVMHDIGFFTGNPRDPDPTPEPDDPVDDTEEDDRRTVDDPIVDDPIADDPIADDPIADDPIADDPIADDPIADDPVGDGDDVVDPDFPLTLTKVDYYRSSGNLRIAGFNAAPNAPMFVNGEFFGNARSNGTFYLKQRISSPDCEFQVTDGHQVLNFNANNRWGCIPR